MLVAQTPIGTEILLPESAAEDGPAFAENELTDAARFYAAEGYAVLRGLVPRPLCDGVRAAFREQVRSSPIPILRQANMRYERNTFDARGHLKNPIFNVQDLDPRAFGGFRESALDALTMPAVIRGVAALLDPGGSPPPVKLIQSMFFEGGVGTWAHQDTYYQDSARALGGCTAGWFALEEIAADAGRFYVLPRSHRMPVLRNGGWVDVAEGHERYRRAVLDAARRHGFQWRAPFLGKGDVLFWNSRTIHGSLTAEDGALGSRASLTAHYLREDDEMLQFHARIRRQELARHNGVTIALLHDQSRWRNRTMRALAFRCPDAWATARRVAIKALLKVRDKRASETAPAVAAAEWAASTAG